MGDVRVRRGAGGGRKRQEARRDGGEAASPRVQRRSGHKRLSVRGLRPVQSETQAIEAEKKQREEKTGERYWYYVDVHGVRIGPATPLELLDALGEGETR